MSENVTFNTFPHNKVEALAMLYLQNQDLSKVTPEELLNLYVDTYEEIKNADLARKKANKEKQSLKIL